jgi:hypothetical protein
MALSNRVAGSEGKNLLRTDSIDIGGSVLFLDAMG